MSEVIDPGRVRNQVIKAPYLTHAALWGAYIETHLGATTQTMCGILVPTTTIQRVLGWQPTCPECLLMDGNDGISLQPFGYGEPMTVVQAVELSKEAQRRLKQANDRKLLDSISAPPAAEELRYNPTTDAFEGEGKTIPADAVGKTRAKLVSTYGMTRAEARAWTRNPGNWMEVSPDRSKIRLPTSNKPSQP